MKVKYEGFIKRQEAQVARQAGKMNKPIPPGRGSHSFPFQLNMRSSVHRMTQHDS